MKGSTLYSFCRKSDEKREDHLHPDDEDNCTDPEQTLVGETLSSETQHRKSRYKENGVTPEILTVTHDHNNPFRVEFDDPQWRVHLASLKPVGLSILLNTCNVDTEQRYSDFYNYLVAESTRYCRVFL